MGCTNCRFIFNGCRNCRKDTFRGKTATKMREEQQAAEAAVWDEVWDGGGARIELVGLGMKISKHGSRIEREKGLHRLQAKSARTNAPQRSPSKVVTRTRLAAATRRGAKPAGQRHQQKQRQKQKRRAKASDAHV